MQSSTPRPRRPRGSLTAESILDAAESVAAEGFGGLTVRSVAARLDAAPMALYRYFATMDELVDALLDRALGRFVPPPATTDWLADLGEFARAHRRVLEVHPWAVTVLFTRPSPGVAATRIGEEAFAILARGRVTGVDAVATFSAVLALNYGWCAFSTARPAAPDLADALAGLPAAVFPHTVAVAQPLAEYGSDDHYERALALLLAGRAGTVGGDG